jgi:hypothetical protein
MAIQLVDLGELINDGTGDDLRTAFIKVNNNFTEIEERLPDSISGVNLGTEGEGVFSSAQGAVLSFKRIDAGSNLLVSSNQNKIILTINPDQNLLLNSDISANNITANTFSGSFSGSFSGDFVGNLTGNADTVTNGVVTTGSYENPEWLVSIDGSKITGSISVDVNGNLTGSVFSSTNVLLVDGENSVLRGLHIGSLEGNVVGDTSGTHTGDVFGDTTGFHTGDVLGNVVGDLTGNTNGFHTGDVSGNVIGQVSDISNHSLSDLNDVEDSIPLLGQALVWSGSVWAPSNVAGAGGGFNVDGGSASTIFDVTTIVLDGGGA